MAQHARQIARLPDRGITLTESPSIAKRALAILALAGAYVLLEWVSSIHEYKGLPFTAWDPGLGLLFAALILKPATAIPALLLGVAAAEAFVLNTALGSLRIGVIALIVTTTYSLVARAIVRTQGFDPALSRLRDILNLLAGGLAGAVMSAGLLLLLLIATGNLNLSDLAPAGWPHIVGNAIGIGVITPLCLRMYAGFRMQKSVFSIAYIPEVLCFLILIAVFAWLVGGAHTRESLQYFYILFIPVVFAAVRHGLTGATIMLALTQAALVVVLDWLDADTTKFTAYQTLMLVLTGTGLLVGAIVSERDMARQQAQAMQWEATRAARFNLVSGMAAALSHEISQPLTAARARARTVERLIEMNDLARTKENLIPLVAQIDRAADILQRMRAFLRRGAPDRKAASWETVSGGAQALLGPLAAEKKVRLEFTQDDSLGPVLCDRVQIEQVLINLAGNAIEAISSGGQNDGRIRVHAARASSEPSLEISVQDNGPGIDPAIAANVFTAMTTTRPDGLGLGIAICVSIIESHQGRLWLEHSQPRNTEFRFRLPLATNGDKI